MNKAKVTISRPSRGDDRRVINVRVKDTVSRQQFVELTFELDAFMLALTGMAEVECEMVTQHLTHVGKVRVREKRTIECPVRPWQKEQIVAWLLENAQEDGWKIDPYLGSQDSVGVSDKPGHCVLNYHVYKFVEAD